MNGEDWKIKNKRDVRLIFKWILSQGKKKKYQLTQFKLRKRRNRLFQTFDKKWRTKENKILTLTREETVCFTRWTQI